MNAMMSAAMETEPMAIANCVKGAIVGRPCPISPPVYERTFNPTRYKAQLANGAAERKGEGRW